MWQPVCSVEIDKKKNDPTAISLKPPDQKSQESPERFSPYSQMIEIFVNGIRPDKKPVAPIFQIKGDTNPKNNLKLDERG